MRSFEPTDASLALFDAILAEDVLLVQRLLREGATPHGYVDRWERERMPGTAQIYPLLVVAAHFGDANIVRALLQAGADVNLCWREARHDSTAPADQRNRWRPLDDALAVAAAAGYVDVVEALLQSNARYGQRALLRAAAARQRDTVRFLLAWGVHPRIDAFYAALGHGDAAIVELFVEHGADLERPQFMGSVTPLGLALSAGYVDVARVLLTKGARLPLRRDIRIYSEATSNKVLAALNLQWPADPDGRKRRPRRPRRSRVPDWLGRSPR